MSALDFTLDNSVTATPTDDGLNSVLSLPEARIERIQHKIQNSYTMTLREAQELAEEIGRLTAENGEDRRRACGRAWEAVYVPTGTGTYSPAPVVIPPHVTPLEDMTSAEDEEHSENIAARTKSITKAAGLGWDKAQPDYVAPDPALDGLSPRAREMVAKAKTADRLHAETSSLRWQVEGLFDVGTLVRFNAAPAGGKTVLLLDLACCVAMGKPFHGRAVEQGTVVYVVAEKPEDFNQRLHAFELEHNGGDPIPNLIIVDEDIPQTGDAEEWDAFIELMSYYGAAMVVLDTQDRLTEGMNEQQGLRPFADAVLRLKRKTGAGVVIAHHLGKKGTDGAGDSAVWRNLSTEAYLTKVKRGGAEVITLNCNKQSSHAPFAKVSFKITPAHGSILLTPTATPAAEVALDAAETVEETPVAEETAPVSVELPEELTEEFSGKFQYNGGESVAVLLARLFAADPDREYGQAEAFKAVGLSRASGGGWPTGKSAWRVLREKKWIKEHSEGIYRWNRER